VQGVIFLLPILQPWVPQHGLSRFGGWLANCEIPWVKDYLIRYFVNRYPVNLEEAIEPNPFAYSSFNDFFTRALQPHTRPIASGLYDFVSPADGCISQMGNIEEGQIFQAKNHNFDVKSLLGSNDETAAVFHQGSFLTVYLAPHDYHRVHMPIDGYLSQMIYVPGRLFSVNTETTRATPNLFARNERVVCLFKTSIGKVAVILVGAMIVGSIETLWAGTITPSTCKRVIQQSDYANPIYLKRGEEMGRFKLGSTAIVLLEKQIIWDDLIGPDVKVLMGQKLGTL
jgi:phosphatidylserine decarboxylase